MTISPEQIKRPDYLKNEARFANGLHTVGGIEGGKSIICNIDNVQADLKTLREIQEEYKFSPDGNIRMNKYQLEKFKIAQEKAVFFQLVPGAASSQAGGSFLGRQIHPSLRIETRNVCQSEVK